MNCFVKGYAMLKHGILGLLNYGNMTGYEIREIFNKSLLAGAEQSDLQRIAYS